MRRIFAILWLALLSFSLLAPALASEPDSSLPACCRRGGKHHCAMATNAAASHDGTGFAARAVCPMYPQLGAVPAGPSVTLLPPGLSLEALHIMQVTGCKVSQPLLPVSRVRVHLQRGPPSFLVIG